MNQLKNQKSAYLKQHENNPVHWFPYGEDAIKIAREQNKPIFLSIGYSTCHWCHVMNHESFEDEKTAQIMNENFINIKVDREEHPDVDQYFQLACQVYNGRGGWPLSVFLTPEMKPYFIGTYFPLNARQSVPSFKEILQKLSNAYKTDKKNVEDNGQKIIEAITQNPKVEQKVEFQGHYPHPQAIVNALKNFQDNEFGGFGTEPKFPQFSLYEWAVEQTLEGMIPQELASHYVLTVEKMVMGGIYDHARGGIHRYSTDKHWCVPHFEKMLYDQAGFLKLLSKTTLLYPSPILFDAIIQTLDYLENEMTSENQYFFAAQDADSEGSEGLFFTFTKDEFIDALVKFDETLSDHTENILKWFKITDQGNFEQNLNVISLDPKLVKEYTKPENWNIVRKVRQALMEERKGRIPPITDNKGIAGWNFMLISALCDILQYNRIEVIHRTANQLLNKTIEGIHKTFIFQDGTNLSKNKIIHTTTRDYHPIFEDFVYFSEMNFRLYEITGNDNFKKNAVQTIQYIFRDFYLDGNFYQRPIELNNESIKNIHVNIFDQSYKSPVATLLILIRKWSTVIDLNEYKVKMEKIKETLTHLSLQSPLGFGETLRALTYPDQAYRKIEVPVSWLQKAEFMKFMPNFSVRFAINFQKEDQESWQVCTLSECEFQGKGIESFIKVFTAQDESNP
jgi:uncharacterized protein YyaL (SSP411 family)